ncbi:MAG: DUF3788 family protein [Proteobacteria bacterium]|nr:DUF3788 family protein [Pseudomonadota bacterium]
MKTEVMSPHITIPGDQELTDLLGEKFFKHYKILSETIISSFAPDLERWDDGSRRGKYFHGYYIYKKFIQIHLFLGPGQLTCYFEFRKKHLDKIEKQKEIFSQRTQKEAEEYGRFPFGFIIDDETFQDTIKAIKILSSTRQRQRRVGAAC